MPDEDERDRPSPLAVRLSQLVREFREERSWSKEDLADESGLHRTHIGLVERGERGLSVESAERIAAAFGLSLSDFIALGERDQAAAETVGQPHAWPLRHPDPKFCLNEGEIKRRLGLSCEWVLKAIDSTYAILDSIDERLAQTGGPVLAGLVELANLSAMIGNMLGAGLAHASDGKYVRNRPHTYPDLLPQHRKLPEIELKTALETNSPKGHLPKPGLHLTFRYVLGDRDGTYRLGKDGRGDTAWIWEARIGELTADDFSISNTEGDSGKTAVIKGPSFDAMPVVYYDEAKCPYKRGRVVRRYEDSPRASSLLE